MEARTPPRPPLLLLLLLLYFPAGTRGQGDFDLADALDDPDPTRRPSSDVHPRPRPPSHPDPGFPENSGNLYPRLPPGGAGHSDTVDGGARPRPRPPSGGGGGGGYDSYGNTHGGDGQATHGDPHGQALARIVSPVVSVVVVALLGAGVSYFRSGRGRTCFRGRDSPETV